MTQNTLSNTIQTPAHSLYLLLNNGRIDGLRSCLWHNLHWLLYRLLLHRLCWLCRCRLCAFGSAFGSHTFCQLILHVSSNEGGTECRLSNRINTRTRLSLRLSCLLLCLRLRLRLCLQSVSRRTVVAHNFRDNTHTYTHTDTLYAGMHTNKHTITIRT